MPFSRPVIFPKIHKIDAGIVPNSKLFARPKKYMAFGFFIIGFIMFFTYFTNASLVLKLIVAATLGATFIEPLAESYFFKTVRTREKQNELYPVYKTSPEISKFITPLLFSTILIYFDFKGLFLFAAFLMLFFALITLKLKK